MQDAFPDPVIAAVLRGLFFENGVGRSGEGLLLPVVVEYAIREAGDGAGLRRGVEAGGVWD